ncbi:hypothetical protein [Sinorhizobium saheli]|uniref:Transporter n=1 Tax=Sinorhizobium saheli TaxID=36856 RepID=A0A178YP55_SINSA|nr:hypothetical protein [Sinorhizobium saheli]MQW88913.1 hypothetical protein [Sinorhizobium saheli]OAP49362.1 hypothetical protein ATB98_20225 [Sinorhizobium saheli]
MPLLDEVLVYIKGLWLLIQGDREGYRWLDISEDGLWRSFTAMLWSLPALAVGWASWRLYYLSAMPSGTTVGFGFFVELMITDLAGWLLPIALTAILARPLGFSIFVVPVIVTTNWLQVPLAYAMAVPAAMLLLVPGSADLVALLWLLLIFANAALLFRLLRTVTANQNLLAAALTTLFLLSPLMIMQFLQHLFGLMPG